MGNEMTLREFRKRYLAEDFGSEKKEVQEEAGWFIWSCPDTELHFRLDRLWEVLDGVNSDYILDNYQVWFDNKRLSNGSLCDEVRFDPMDRRLALRLCFGISVGDARHEKKYRIFTARNNFFDEEQYDKVTEVWKFINNWESALQDKTFYEKKAGMDRYRRG